MIIRHLFVLPVSVGLEADIAMMQFVSGVSCEIRLCDAEQVLD